MNKNIFEGAKFGDKFDCKNGDVVVYQRTIQSDNCVNVVVVFNNRYDYLLNDDGSVYNIAENPDSMKVVSKHVEHVDEDKLNKLAENEGWNLYTNDEYDNPVRRDSFILGFKEGYKIAKMYGK